MAAQGCSCSAPSQVGGTREKSSSHTNPKQQYLLFFLPSRLRALCGPGGTIILGRLFHIRTEIFPAVGPQIPPHSFGSSSPRLQGPPNTSCSRTGLPDDQIQKGKDIKSISEIVQDGNKFKITVTTGSKVLHNEFTIGEECDMEMLTGEKVKVSDQLLLCQGCKGSGTLNFLSSHSPCTWAEGNDKTIGVKAATGH